MDKKGFSLIGMIIGLLVLLFVLQYAMKHYQKSLSKISAVKTGVAKPKSGKQGFSVQEGILLKVNILPQLDNLARQQELMLSTRGAYAKDISVLNAASAPNNQYRYGATSDASGWVVWVKKVGGNNKFQLFKNAKTKQLCCKDIDNESCQYLDIGAKKCPF